MKKIMTGDFKPLEQKLNIRAGVALCFVVKKSELERSFKALKQVIPKDGAVWIGWPKRGSGIETDLNENVIREVGLQHGLVDVKVISTNEQWSALKFVYRLKDR